MNHLSLTCLIELPDSALAANRIIGSVDGPWTAFVEAVKAANPGVNIKVGEKTTKTRPASAAADMQSQAGPEGAKAPIAGGMTGLSSMDEGKGGGYGDTPIVTITPEEAPAKPHRRSAA